MSKTYSNKHAYSQRVSAPMQQTRNKREALQRAQNNELKAISRADYKLPIKGNR